MKKRYFKIPLIILGDILMGALVLAIFFASKFAGQGEAVSLQPSPTPAALSAPSPSPSQEPEDDGRTPWQKKFEDKFSDEIVSTDHSYKSPNVSIEIETVNTEIDGKPVAYHVADIYVASTDNFRCYTANGEMRFYATQSVNDMDEASNAILSMSGDFFSYQASCFIVRNSQLYKQDDVSCDICVMYPDGSIEMLKEGQYQKEELLSRNPLQIWNFGPSLLDENGEPYPEYYSNYNISRKNPRSALGYYEPGHYCFVVVDGRQNDYSVGVDLPQLAEIFKNLGCSSAYNLDGGGSAVMLFNHERYSRQSNGGDRSLGDILLICETEAEK